MQKLIEDRNLFIEALISAKDNMYYNYDNTIIQSIISSIVNDENKHFISISQDEFNKISYAKNIDHIYDSSKRIKTTFERYVRRQLNISSDDLSDVNLNYLGQQIRNKIVPLETLELKLKILSGEDISQHYKDLGKDSDAYSCMTGRDSYKTQIYALNPDKVSLLVFDTITRALLWTTTCGKKILDRLYPNNCETSSLLKSWATRKGYVTRDLSGVCNDDCIELSDKNYYKFELLHKDVFPYIDTFCYGIIYGDKVTLTNKKFNNCKIFQSTHGVCCADLYCFICESNLDNSESFRYDGEDYCEDCYNDRFSCCYNCEDIFSQDNLIEGLRNKFYCSDCFNERFFECEYCDIIYLISEAESTDSGLTCSDCFLENYFRCDTCGEGFDKKEEISHNDESYCQYCFDEKYVKCTTCEDVIELKSASYVEAGDSYVEAGDSYVEAGDDEPYCKNCFESIVPTI